MSPFHVDKAESHIPFFHSCGQLLSQLRQLVGGIANEDSAHLSSDPFAANSIVDATHQLNEVRGEQR